MWTTKETKREYRGLEIIKYEGSKMKDTFRKKDPRTFQSGDSKFTKCRTGKRHNCHMTEGVKDLWNIKNEKLECYGSKRDNLRSV